MPSVNGQPAVSDIRRHAIFRTWQLLPKLGLVLAFLIGMRATLAGPPMQRFSVVAAHPLASQAAIQILRAGGSALDAAIAAQMVLTLVEPQASGIGGGAFLMHWDGRVMDAWDGRETAPAEADERLFLQPDGRPMPFMQAVVGGRAVGVPGLLRMLEQAHRRHGQLPWEKLFEPAIELAEQGFAITPRLHAQLQFGAERLRQDPLAGALYFGPQGLPHPVGFRLRNPALGQLLRQIARGGSDVFYRGPIAADMVSRVRSHGANPGWLSEQDLAGYQPRRRQALCTDWLELWRVCGFPPPSSGHLTIMQMLGMLAALPAQGPDLQDGLPSSVWLHRYNEVARLAFADRALYVADPDFVQPPAGDWRSLLAPDYLRQRASLVGPRSMGTAAAGQPGAMRSAYVPQPTQAEYGTSHLSVVDGQGRVVAMTSTIEAVWGAHLMSDGGTGLPGGFFLNNQLTDFSFAPSDGRGHPIANRVQPGKRPRSSMSPTLVFRRGDGQLVLSAGSPGGAAIIHYTAKSLIGTLLWGLSPQQAIELPNFGNFNGPTLLEQGRFSQSSIEAMKALGHAVEEAPLVSGLHLLQRTPKGWVGGADPRREGLVLGD
ncbi:MAG: gamma-glutamyltransferase family protein [Hylemonella sp.]